MPIPHSAGYSHGASRDVPVYSSAFTDTRYFFHTAMAAGWVDLLYTEMVYHPQMVIYHSIDQANVE